MAKLNGIDLRLILRYLQYKYIFIFMYNTRNKIFVKTLKRSIRKRNGKVLKGTEAKSFLKYKFELFIFLALGFSSSWQQANHPLQKWVDIVTIQQRFPNGNSAHEFFSL